MDCCENNKDNQEKKTKTKMDKKLILWIVIALLVLGVIYFVFFKEPTASGQAVSSAGQAAKSYGGMVGGC